MTKTRQEALTVKTILTDAKITEKLLEMLDSTALAYIPNHVVAINRDAVAWWTPAAIRRMYFRAVALGYGGLKVVAFDPDTVAPANIVRQRYSPSDIGLPKAIVLINRVNLAYAFDWEGIQSRFTGSYANRSWDMVISCVDTTPRAWSYA